MQTHFAPAERSSSDSLLKDFKILSQNEEVKLLLNAVSNFIVIVNESRQIVYANDVFINFIKKDDPNFVIGMRPGEAIKCIHSTTMKGGCGTSQACRECGAINAILESQKKKDVAVYETRLTLSSGESLDLLVKATPYITNDRIYTIASLADISADKRRRALERIFFHDVLNTAGVLKGYCEIIQMSDDEEREELLKTSGLIALELIEEIQAQKNLLAVESGDYQLDLTVFSTKELVESLVNSFKGLNVAHNKKISSTGVNDIEMESDRILLRRIITNLLKNALEATLEQESVSIECHLMNDEIVFHVKNPKVLPQNIKLQMFQRSFSTKGHGRGLGTYSVKLLSEKYLKGRVYFESSEETGTIFSVVFPVKHNN